MRYVHSIKVKPFITDDGNHYLIHPFNKWLEKNNIVDYQGGEWTCWKTGIIYADYVTYWFEYKEDFIAFKLMWSEREYVEQT